MTDRRANRQAKAKRKRFLRRIFIIGFPTTLLLGLLTIILVLSIQDPHTGEPQQSTLPGTETVIELAFAGDLNISDKVVAAGMSDNGYNYSKVLQDVLPLLADADQTVLNFEGNLCGSPYGTASASAPPEILEALSSAGVDLLQVANSCTIKNGLLGLGDTLSSIRAAGMEPLGAYSSPDEFQQNRGFVLRDVQGIKVAFVAFTKGMDNISLPTGQEDCVNLLYKDYTSTYQNVDTDGITKILRAVAAEDPDVTIALLHWGSEFNSQISSSQAKIVKLMKSEGVDAIIGTHSHCLQQVEFDEEKGTLVAYSLGDFWGDAERSASTYSAVIKLQVAKNDQTGQTRIRGFEYEPIFTYTKETESGISTQLLRINPAIEEFEANGISAVPEDVYKAMKSALSKAEKLMTQKESD